MKWKSLVIETVTIFFLLLWVYAAASKLIDYQQFSVQLSKSPMLTNFSQFTAWLVPSIELGICVLLFFSRSRLAGLYASFGLMTAFTAYIYAITHYAEVVPCSCGGILEDMTWEQHFVFNIICVIIAATPILLYPGIEEKEELATISRHKILFE